MAAADAVLTGVDRRQERDGRQVAWLLPLRGRTCKKLDTQRAVQSQAEGRASASGNQKPTRLCEDLLAWLGQEHRATGNAVRTAKSVDGTPIFTEEYGRSAPAI